MECVDVFIFFVKFLLSCFFLNLDWSCVNEILVKEVMINWVLIKMYLFKKIRFVIIFGF